MRHILLFLFFTLVLFADNMTLGPYNDPDFISQEEQTLEAQKLKDLQEKEEKRRLQAYEKRQAELRRLKEEEECQRLAESKEKERRTQIKAQIQENLRQKDLEEREKKHLSQTTYTTDDSNLTLVAMQKNTSAIGQDDIETEISNVTRLRGLLMRSDKTPESIKDYIRFLNRLHDDHHIDVAFSYRGIAQAELDSSTFGGGGKYDMTVIYHPIESTAIAMRVEGYHQIGPYSSSEFRQEFGALSATSASYRKDDIYMSQLFLQHDVSDLTIRAGKLDPSDFLDSHLYKSSNRFFFNSSFSTNPYNAYPQNGLGLGTKYIKNRYYFAAEINDANADKEKVEDTFFSEREYYKAFEMGLTPEDGSKYHITVWHRDLSQVSVESKGVIGSFVQTLDPSTHLIIRGALSDNAKAKGLASVGLGKTSLFKENDISGVAIGSLIPSDETQRTQTTLESFYRMDPIPGVQLSADLQFIYHPSLGDQTWAILPGVRLRVLF